MEEHNKKQHYIPQCYLRCFSPNSKSIYVYDKIESKSYRAAIHSVACEDYFYRIPEKYIVQNKSCNLNRDFYEKEFFSANVEPMLNLLLKKVIESSTVWSKNRQNAIILTDEEKEDLVQILAIQQLRLPSIRKKCSNGIEKLTNARSSIIQSYLKCIDPNINVESVYNTDYDPILHSEIYADVDLISKMGDFLLGKYWVYFFSSKNDFYTSDNPIIVFPNNNYQESIFEGFGMIGADVVFPISSSILLVMFDNGKNEYERDSFRIIEESEKRKYNSYQYCSSDRFTFSYADNFNLIELLKICNDNKEFFQKKSTIQVNGK